MTNAVDAQQATGLQWDCGTGYELFLCLMVLHQPERYGLRASWAAGIRSRIPAAERKLLEEVLPFLTIPITWIYRLSGQKDVLSVLWALRQIPASERIWKIFEIDEWDDPEIKRLLKISEKHAWDQDDLSALTKSMCGDEFPGRDQQALQKFLDLWKQLDQFGEMYLSALQAFHQVFFADEEKRVTPVLQAGLERAQALSQTLEIRDLLAELSQGVHVEPFEEGSQVILLPAYWITPLLMHAEIKRDEKTTFIYVFGVRPANMSVVPGEIVPDGLLRTLKALADPTRLKIIYYLSKEELTPSELARRLHLRAPTVTHHLSELRLAGLVNLTFHGQEKRYTARREALPATFNNLEMFLDNPGDDLSNSLDDGTKKLEDRLEDL